MSTHSLHARPRLLATGVPTPDVLERAQREFDLKVWREGDALGERLIDEAAGFDALLVMPGDKLDASMIQRLPASVKAIATHSVGFDHVDVSAATRRGIPVFNTPDVLTEAVADLAMFLVLAAARNTTGAEASLREGRWGRWAPGHYLGRSLNVMRLGIFGMGRIGQAVARRAAAFGMAIHYHNRSRLPAELERGGAFHETLEDLLPSSDVLCVCAPSTPALRHSLDARRLALLPRGAMVVNIARGELIDEPALFEAVHAGQVGAVGIDVFQQEPAIDRRWLALPHSTLLPHIGSATREVRSAMGMLALDGLRSHFTGTRASNLLNPAAYDVASSHAVS